MPQSNKPALDNDPDSFSTADNNSNSTDVFVNRVKYRDEIFPDAAPFSYFNFWEEDRYYGRINSLGNAVVLREDRLKQLKYCDAPTPLFAFNFVADAWRDFVEKIREAATGEKLIPSGPYANLAATKAWRSIPTQYNTYMSDTVYPVFSEVFMSVMSENNKKVTGFDSYLEVLTNFCEIGIKRGSPMTLSGYIESILCSPLNTGLVIEIGDTSHAEDYEKCDEFLYDPNFTTVVRIASNYGFVIDKNAPWRFVADIRSPVMREYMTGVRMSTPPTPLTNDLLECNIPFVRNFNIPEPYGYSAIGGLESVLRHATGYEEYELIPSKTTEEEIFEEFFTQAYLEAWQVDMEMFKVYALDFYNTYVTDIPVVSTRIVADVAGDWKCVNPHRLRHKTEAIFRQVISSFDEVFGPESGKYGDKWSLRCYYNLRILERNKHTSHSSRLKNLQDAMNIYYFAPPSPAGRKYFAGLRHIHQELVGPVTADFLTFTKIDGKI